MRIVRDILALALVASAIVSMQILFTDQWLWSAAPSHAYGLIGFVIVDILLTIGLLENITASILGAALASLVQIGAMVGDMFFGLPQGVASSVFRAYLVNDLSYAALLIIEAVTAVVAIASLANTVTHHQFDWTRVLHFLRHRARSSG